MTTTSTPAPRGGMGLPGVLLVIFIVLKLAGVVAWPWIWVLAPLWITLALALVIGVVVGTVLVIKNKN